MHAKFQSGLTPRSGFLPIDIPFLANIWREYFSFNILTVLYQSELELSYLDQNWAKTRHLLFKTFESSNAMDSPIVHCLNMEKNGSAVSKHSTNLRSSRFSAKKLAENPKKLAGFKPQDPQLFVCMALQDLPTYWCPLLDRVENEVPPSLNLNYSCSWC